MSDTIVPVPLTLNDQVELLFNEIQRRKAEIVSATKESYVTDCQFRFSTSSELVDIRAVRYVNKVQEYLAFLIGKVKDYDEAGKLLGLTAPKPFNWYGATFDQWANDLKIRATQLDLTERKETLTKLEEKLMAIASPEFVRSLELKKIEAALAS